MRSKFRQELSNTSFLSSQFQLDDKKTTKKPSDLSVDLTTKKKINWFVENSNESKAKLSQCRPKCEKIKTFIFFFSPVCGNQLNGKLGSTNRNVVF